MLAYFDREQRSSGWLEGGGSSGGRSTQEWDAASWHKGDRILRLAHRRNTLAAEVPGSFIPIYRVTLIGQAYRRTERRPNSG